MASQRASRSAVPVDLTAVARGLRAAAGQIRSDARARYELEVERAAALEAAAVQIELPGAVPVPSATATPAPAATAAKASRRPGRPAKAGRPAKKAAARRPVGRPPKKAAGRKVAARATKKAAASPASNESLMDQVVGVVRNNPNRSWNTAQVADAVGAQAGTVSTFLARAAGRGLIARRQRGIYTAA
jgi:hypothetical protein